MTNNELIDLFACFAMQGYLTQSYIQNQECIAHDSYSMAEIMIKERAKRLTQKEQSND